MKRIVVALSLAVLVAGTTVIFGQEGRQSPFIDSSDTGETVHVLPPPAAIRSPHDTQPTVAPAQPGLSVFPASYGSGNLVDHKGPEIPSAGFFAVYWNDKVANAGGSGVTSLGYGTVQSQISAFLSQFSDGVTYSQSDPGADYTVVQQYGSSNAIGSGKLSPTLTTLGYYVDTKASQTSISDSGIQSYLGGLFSAGTIPVSTSTVYGVYFPPGMRVKLSGGVSCVSFCGYHGHFSYKGQDIKYASFPYTNCSACKLSSLSVADMLTIVTSHEIREAVTDPDLNAWSDAAGDEADDKCAWHNLYPMTNGGFWIQPEYSNGGTVSVAGVPVDFPGPGCVVAK